MAYTEAQWMPAKRRSKTDELRLFRIYAHAVLRYLAPLFAPFLTGAVLAFAFPPVWSFITVATMVACIPPAFFFGLKLLFATKGSSPSTLLGEVELPVEGTQISSFPAIVVCRSGNRPLGSDEGTLSFVDGKLCFEGRQLNVGFGRECVGRITRTPFSLPGLDAVTLSFKNVRGLLGLTVCVSAEWTQHKWIREQYEQRLSEWDQDAAPTDDNVIIPQVVDPWPKEFVADSMRRVSGWAAAAMVAFLVALGMRYALSTTAGHFAHIRGHPQLAMMERLWFGVTFMGFIICFLVTGICSIFWQAARAGGVPL